MVKHGEAPFLECSSAGDRRFSAFSARVLGRSIEEHYQGAKVFADGSTGLSWRQAKGRRPVNIGEVTCLYYELWRFYLNENPHLLDVLVNATGLSDIYGKAGHTCQASTLWRIRAEELIRRQQKGP